MPQVEFKSTTPAFEWDNRVKVNVLERAAGHCEDVASCAVNHDILEDNELERI
jgi:hypothetical protein